jgi:hydrogenase maturation protein HypF
LDLNKWETIKKMLNQKINIFPTSSAGRLFDCVSVLLNWREQTNYEGQPAIELESLADENIKGKYAFEISKEKDIFIIHPELIIRGVVKDLTKKEEKSKIAAKFHNTIAQIINDVSARLKKEYDLNDVCLSGGVFQNIFLLDRTYHLLEENKFKVYTHHQVPTNDGGISLGQAVIVNQRI